MTRDTILFDINETVLDLSPLKPRFETTLGDAGLASTWFATLLHTSAVCAVTGVKAGFAELAGLTLDRLASLQGRALSDPQRSDILGSFSSLAPHPDVKPALEQLRACGYRTVAFSNSSRELLQKQIANAGLAPDFDLALSVEETGSFKPDAKVYVYAAARVGRPISTLRLIAAHDWDTHGAMTAGMKAAYLDRSGALYNPVYRRPDISATTMGRLVDRIIAEDAKS